MFRSIAFFITCFIALMATMSSAIAAIDYHQAELLLETQGTNSSIVRWYRYRDTIVALSDNGKPMCIRPADGQKYCKPAGTVQNLPDFIRAQAAANQVLICDSADYVKAWGPVPDDGSHWCKAFSDEALTVRTIIEGGRITYNKIAATHNVSLQFDDPRVGFLVPQQPGASGPQTLVWSQDPDTTTFVTVNGVNAATGKVLPIVLRATRLFYCGYRRAMNTAGGCYGVKNTQLEVAFDLNDNPTLPTGEYRALFTVEPKRWQDETKLPPFSVRVHIRRQ